MSIKQSIFKKQIIKKLYFGGTLSNAELSVLTKKNLQVTSKAVNQLVAEGSVLEAGFDASTGGRYPQLFSVRPDLCYVVSVAMDQLVTRIVLIDMHNTFIGEVEEFKLTLSNDPSVLENLAMHLNQFILDSGIPKEKIAGIGIGMPGFVDKQKGLNYSFLKVKEGSIVSFLESLTNLPVLIDNDSSLIALAEFRMGIARAKQNVMVLNIGWGMGLGMILNGEIFRGHDGLAGEFSHIPLFTNNKICSCGKMGCLETETSLLIILNKVIDGLKQGKLSVLKNLSPDHAEEAVDLIMKAALSGDKFVIEILSEAGYNIGRGIAILVHLLNPQMIVLSGRGSIAGKLWITPIQQALNEYCIPKMAENLEIKVSSLGYKAEILGAASLIMEHYDQLHEYSLPNQSSIQTVL